MPQVFQNISLPFLAFARMTSRKRQAADSLLPVRSAKYQRTEENQGIWNRWRQLGTDAFTLGYETVRLGYLSLMNCEISSIARHDRSLTTCSKPLKIQVDLKSRHNSQKNLIKLAFYPRKLPTWPCHLVCLYQKSYTNPKIHNQ